MSLILPTAIDTLDSPRSVVHEPYAPRSETITIGKTDEFTEAITSIRNMVSIAIGCVKDLKSQAYEKYKAPGMRIIIGHILDLLGQVQLATKVKPSDFKIKPL